VGIPTFESRNGRMMKGDGGASLLDLRVCDGKRQSVFRSYTFPYMDRPNLTVLTHALVTRVTFKGKQATGVEIAYDSKTRRISARLEVMLSLGAIHTPKVLMQSGIGDHLYLGISATARSTRQRGRSNLLLVLASTLRICRLFKLKYRSAVLRR